MAGIYIHIPFCKQKCSYCDFHFSTTYENYRADMISAISSEIESRIDYLENEEVETVYFGGGTPSLLEYDELTQLLNNIRKNFKLSENVEISLEANPDDITTTRLEEWKKCGINRLSIGIQSFRKEDLEWMNRAHSVAEGESCIVLAQKAGFQNITVDLMYGLPDLTLDEWKSHIQHVIDSEVPHISAYCLTVEKNTALSNWVEKGKIVPASEDTQSDQFLILLDLLEEHGFEQYEISNFCKPGYHSKHNSNYWKGVKYLGVGPSAHSFNGQNRQWNVSNNPRYLKLIQNKEPHFEMEVLSTIDRFNELLLTGLRTNYGVDLVQLKTLNSLSEEFFTKTRTFVNKGWLEMNDNVLKLTTEGKLKADLITSELFIV